MRGIPNRMHRGADSAVCRCAADLGGRDWEVLRQFNDQAIIVEAGNFDDAVASASDSLDLVRLEFNMQDDTRENGVQRIAATLPDGCRLIILSASDDQRQIRRAIELGEAGFISKSSSNESWCSYCTRRRPIRHLGE